MIVPYVIICGSIEEHSLGVGDRCARSVTRYVSINADTYLPLEVYTVVSST